MLSEIAQDSKLQARPGACHPRRLRGSATVHYVITQRDNILPPFWQRRIAERAGSDASSMINTPHKPFVSHPALLADVLQVFELGSIVVPFADTPRGCLAQPKA